MYLCEPCHAPAGEACPGHTSRMYHKCDRCGQSGLCVDCVTYRALSADAAAASKRKRAAGLAIVEKSILALGQVLSDLERLEVPGNFGMRGYLGIAEGDISKAADILRRIRDGH